MIHQWMYKAKYMAMVMTFLSSGLVHGLSAEIATMVEEARTKVQSGDLGAAAVLYYRALQMDESGDPSLHTALTELVMQEAAGFDAERTESEILHALERALAAPSTAER